MRHKSIKAVWFGIASVLLAASVSANHQRAHSMASDERAIRSLVSGWIEAYENLDAKGIAALETPDVEVVDRFGVLRLASGRTENEKLWSDSFEMVSKNTAAPTFTIDHIRFLRPDVAVVQVSLRISEGILLVDGDRIPPYSQLDSYVVVKVHGVWLVAAHNMQEKKP